MWKLFYIFVSHQPARLIILFIRSLHKPCLAPKRRRNYPKSLCVVLLSSPKSDSGNSGDIMAWKIMRIRLLRSSREIWRWDLFLVWSQSVLIFFISRVTAKSTAADLCCTLKSETQELYDAPYFSQAFKKSHFKKDKSLHQKRIHPSVLAWLQCWMRASIANSHVTRLNVINT